MEAVSAKTRNPVVWIYRYFRESKEELQKVTWPSRQDTIRYSTLVVVVVVGMGAFFAALDWALNLGFTELLKLAHK
jgi:preprotein translocase SecE subunit